MVSEKQSEGFWHLAILIKKFPNKDSLAIFMSRNEVICNMFEIQ